MICLIALALFVDLRWGRWARAAVTGVVVDLGEPRESGTLRERLARTLGDPTLLVGYRLPEQEQYVDEAATMVGSPGDRQHFAADVTTKTRAAWARGVSPVVRAMVIRVVPDPTARKRSHTWRAVAPSVRWTTIRAS